MPIYTYVKKKNRIKNRYVVFISYTFLTFGTLFLFWSFYPIISFEIYSRLFIPSKVFNPIAQNDTYAIQKAGSVVENANIFSTNLTDYTKAGIWFPTVKQTEASEIAVKEYTLSIPKLGITDAKVTVAGENLAHSLVHYLPRSLPGERGNVAIFGHSTLSQLYNVKDYKTIFTYLPTLKKGDKAYITLNDIVYEYEVFDSFVVSPEQISVLDQKYDDAYLTLITCVPPGTFWKRLIVRAKLVK
jgi:sortase A